MTNILLSFRHTKYSKIKVTVRPEQKRHLICPEIAWSVRIEHIVWFTWNRPCVYPKPMVCFIWGNSMLPPPPLHPQTSMNKRLWRGHANLYFAITLHSSYIRPKREPVCNKYKKEENPGRFSSFTIKITDCINVVITLLPYHQLHNRAPFSCWQAYDRTLLSSRQ